ncbi:MAG: hypothetical protein KTR14_05150 [Vampirovibrio sp.]|nr:hypothetical protein [Vampirovibrio sp.]
MSRPIPLTDNLMTYLWQHVMGSKGPAIKDTSRTGTAKFDGYLHSTPSEPLSFTVFPMSDTGELEVDDVERLVGSEATYLLFINPNHHWLVAVRNTTQNKGKLGRGESVEQMKVKLTP